jgi:hypothetical protein
MTRSRVGISILLGTFLMGLLAWLSWPPGGELVLPYPSSLRDDVQYFAPGPDFPLVNEEAALAENQAPTER